MSLISRVITRTAFLIAAASGSMWAQAADFPTQPVRLVIPYAAGGGADNTARVIAQKMSENLGQAIIVENRPGASGTVAEGAVIRSAPDGYTVLYDTFAYAVNASMRELPFNLRKDLAPVSMTATAAMIFVVNPSVKQKTLPEFLEHLRAHPGTASYASFGIGSSAHLATELLNGMAQVDMLHVPYKGGAPALTDVVGGQVDAYFANASSGLPYVKSGQLRPLAVSSAQRLSPLPDVPTVAESGFKDFEVLDWHGIFVPAGTPQPVIDRLAEAVKAATSDPAVIERLNTMGIQPAHKSPADFSAFLEGQINQWTTLIKERNISLN